MSVLISAGGQQGSLASNHSGASSVLALLEEEEDSLKIFALEQMNANMNEYWFQLSGSISLIEALYEDEGFGQRELCALVLSKVFYHLDDLDEALVYALGAQNLVDVNGTDDFSKTVLACCVDKYTVQRKAAASRSNGEEEAIDERLLVIVERLFEKCINDGQLEQAVGLSLESHRLDMLQKVLTNSNKPSDLVQYVLKTTHVSISSKRYRDEILNVIVEFLRGDDESSRMATRRNSKDLTSMMKCLLILDRPEEASEILLELMRSGADDDILMAYQLSFDISESENQSFSTKLRQLLSKSKADICTGIKEHSDAQDDLHNVNPAELVDGEENRIQSDTVKEKKVDKMALLDQILSQEIPMELERQFLARNNATDVQILKNIKATVEPRNSVCHGATVFANAMMNASTTNDSFLRENLDWLAKATNWSKFSATAGLGVIHKGNIANSKSVLSPYLPSSSSSTSPYSEGGSLYAIGMMHSNHSVGITDFILEFLKNSQNEVIQHGACLGLGIAGMGSEDLSTFEEIKNVLYNDNAVSGEAAGLAMGLLFAGTGSELSQEMLAYAHDTQHEKIIRGIAIGLASIQYGREEKAETMIDAMTLDQDAILRYGGMFAIGLAYCGTGDNAAIHKLLHFAVSDVSNDVRRAAVLCLGFVLAGNPELCVKTVSLLAESYNPHVRYGAAMALGISGAGSGCKESVSLLQTLWKDATDFVQQGALIASSMLLVEQPPPKQEKLRERINQLHGNRGVELMTRMGAIMASGILDAAGRNSTLSLRTDVGGLRRSAVLGLALFVQYWYWYPMTHAIALALKPTALIGVDITLAPPADFSTTCHCRKTLFAYPANVAVESKKLKEKMPKAMLSTSRKKKVEIVGAEKMDEDAAVSPQSNMDDADMDEAGKKEAGKEVAAKDDNVFELGNPARVVPLQRDFVRLTPTTRWKPVRFQPTGIIVLKNTAEDQPVEYVFAKESEERESENQNTAEASAPEPFDYIPS
jgi:26S proteasome regulatory subunit N2